MNLGANRKLVDDVDRQNIRRLYADGHERVEIAKRVGWSVGTVDRVLYRRRYEDGLCEECGKRGPCFVVGGKELCVYQGAIFMRRLRHPKMAI